MVKCNAKDGLVCLNKDQGLTQQCFDYEIRVLCCDENCGTSTKQTPPPTTTTSSTTTSMPTSTTHSSSSSTSISTTQTTTATPSATPSTSPSKTPSAIPSTTPSATSPTSTTPKTTTITPTSSCGCRWSDWLDFGGPTPGSNGGQEISIKEITDTIPFLCTVPVQVECRAKLYPGLHLSQLGQVVKCNAKDGLVCVNKDQNITQQCFYYEIRVLCCNGNCDSSTHTPVISTTLTTHSTTLTPCSCSWSEWIDFGGPTTGSGGGEIIPIKGIMNIIPNTCSAPAEIECRAKLYPDLKLYQLGQVVTCNTEDGLVCLNKNQGVTQQCFDYEIRVYCCQGSCDFTSTTWPTQYSSSSTISTTGLPVVTGSTTGHSTEPQNCVCEINGETFEPGSVIYNQTDGDGWCYIAKCVKTEEAKCDVLKLSVPCLTTVSPSTSTPWNNNCDNHIPPLTNGESVNVGNCYIKTCVNGTIKHDNVQCGPVDYPVCENQYQPVKVPDESGCCYKYECQCVCNGFGDPHYITFDGTYYPFQGNCSYVLVKEIHPKNNFSVIIDNVFCDAQDGLSCPKSLTVYYKSFEVFMSQEISQGIVTNVVYVNHKRVSLPFQNEDFRVTENGIESLMVIPATGAQISFTGLMFSIRLPWQFFHGNTEGQCGTCNNNKTDDCRLPNGTVISSCQSMAPHWHVNNSNSVCPLPKPEPTPKPCPPAAICTIIESELFAKCQNLVPYEPYMKACNFDVCHVNTRMGCSSLQAYADECAMAGICVDWRNATDGVCDFKCKEPLVYEACGPQVQPTCDGRFNQKYIRKDDVFRSLESITWEGCYCPNGTTLLSPASKVCVPTCEICLLPNGEWKKANDVWITGCEMCTCEEETLSVRCKTLPCPTQASLMCDEIGQVMITETLDCCKKTKCVCDVNLCPSINFTCPVGYSVNISMGVCCPVHDCRPKPVCVFNNTEYNAGSVVPVGQCEDCVCGDDVDPETKLHSVDCHPVQCDVYCQLGYEYQPVVGQCCGECVQTSCVVVYEGNITYAIKPGEVWSPSADKCVKFECMEIGKQFITIQAQIVCPDFNPNDCVPGTEVIGPDGCCPACVLLPKQCNVSKKSTYLESNGCKTRTPVEMGTCDGSCGTYSMYSTKDNAVQHSCSCCREMSTSEREAELVCSDGSNVIITYVYIEKCGCVDTDCGVRSIATKTQRHKR